MTTAARSTFLGRASAPPASAVEGRIGEVEATHAVCLAIFVCYASDMFAFIARMTAGPVGTALYVTTYLVILSLCFRAMPVVLRGLLVAPFLLALHVVTMLSVLWSVDVDASVGSIPALFPSVLLGYYVGVRYSLRGLARFMVIGCVWIALANLFAVAAVPGGAGDPESVWPNTWRGFHNQKNGLGESSAIVVVACVFGAVVFDGWLKRFAALGLAVGLLLLWQSESRSAQIMAIVVLGVLVSGLAAGHALRPWLRAVFLIGVSLALIVYVMFSSGITDEIFAAIGRKPTMSGRIPIWAISAEFIAQRPWLGYGYSAFWDDTATRLQPFIRAPDVKHYPYYAHNGYVDTLLFLGKIGFIFLMLAITTTFQQIWSTATARTMNIYIVLIVAFMWYFLLTNITESRILGRNMTWLLFVAVATRFGILAALVRAEARRSALPTFGASVRAP
jgi:O-antigen ligase